MSGYQPFFVTLNFLEFFHLQHTLNSEFFRGGVQALTFFGDAKFEVKKFLEFFGLQSALDSEFIRRSVQAPTFFGHAKFKIKIF